MTRNKNYTNGKITVHWQPDKCQHSAECISHLPKVFNANTRPWINMEGASTEEIIRVVDICPSGALTYSYSDKK